MADAKSKNVQLSSGAIQSTLQGNPVAQFSDLLRRNMSKATKRLRRGMKKVVLRRLGAGVPNEGYRQSYAIKKSIMTGRSYTSSGPVDFQHSGQLKKALTAKGKANPAKNQIQVGLTFDKESRRPFKRSPGADPSKTRELTNTQVAQYLNREKSGSLPRGAIGLQPQEERRLLELVASSLTGD